MSGRRAWYSWYFIPKSTVTTVGFSGSTSRSNPESTAFLTIARSVASSAANNCASFVCDLCLSHADIPPQPAFRNTSFHEGCRLGRTPNVAGVQSLLGDAVPKEDDPVAVVKEELARLDHTCDHRKCCQGEGNPYDR